MHRHRLCSRLAVVRNPDRCMLIVPTTDMKAVKAFISNHEIWDRMSEDGVDLDSFEPFGDESNMWLFVFDEKIKGIIYVHIDTDCSIGFHPYMLKEFRRDGRDMIKEFFRWFVDNADKRFIKINVTIPDCFKSAVNFAKKTGFTHEGVCRSSYRKNGIVYDRNFLGITRSEIEALL